MTRTDIYGGLKNAIERGVPLETAIQSFINAGYKESDVRDVAKRFSQGAISITSQQYNPEPSKTILSQQTKPVPQTHSQLGQQVPQQIPTQTYLQTPQSLQQPTSKKSLFLIIILIILLSFLIFVIFFKNKITDFFNSLV